MAHLQKVGPIVPQDADDRVIGQRPTFQKGAPTARPQQPARPTTGCLYGPGEPQCTGCGHVWRQDTSPAATPQAKLSRGGLRWALEGIVCQHLTVARVADGLGVAWNTANNAVLADGMRVLIDDSARFDGVAAIGVDEKLSQVSVQMPLAVSADLEETAVEPGALNGRCRTGRPERAL
jgi:hypothetical protein